jgi:hypothetical protein
MVDPRRREKVTVTLERGQWFHILGLLGRASKMLCRRVARGGFVPEPGRRDMSLAKADYMDEAAEAIAAACGTAVKERSE